MANYKHLSFRERWQVMNKKTRIGLLFLLALPYFVVFLVNKGAEYIAEKSKRLLYFCDKAIKRQ